MASRKVNAETREMIKNLLEREDIISLLEEHFGAKKIHWDGKGNFVSKMFSATELIHGISELLDEEYRDAFLGVTRKTQISWLDKIIPDNEIVMRGWIQYGYDSYYAYHFEYPYDLAKAKKEKGVLYIPIRNSNDKIMINFITKTIDIPTNYSFLKNADFTDIFQVDEWIFSYLDLLDLSDYFTVKFYISGLPCFGENAPKGYIPWCREYNKTISERTVLQYKFFVYGKSLHLSSEEINTIINSRGYVLTESLGKSLLLEYSEKKPLLKSILKYSIADIYQDNQRALDDIENAIKMGFQCANASINTNRRLARKYIETNAEKFYAQKIEEFLAKVNLPVDGYTIKTLNSHNDLVNEGKIQHNCIGSFYDINTLLNREQVIISVRDGNKILFSARYDLKTGELLEARKKFNEPLTRADEEICKKLTENISVLAK